MMVTSIEQLKLINDCSNGAQKMVKGHPRKNKIKYKMVILKRYKQSWLTQENQLAEMRQVKYKMMKIKVDIQLEENLILKNNTNSFMVVKMT